MLSLGALLLTAGLVLVAPQGVGYGGLFIADAFSRFVQILILAGAALAIILALDFNRQDAALARLEFPVLILFATAGMMIMVSATNLMTLYLGLELQSLALYVIATFARDSLRSAEAGLKYFVLGSLASGLLLYGISLTYGFSGSMDFGHIAQALLSGTPSVGLIIGMVFVLSGLVFKMAAVPFHMWSPDVYEGAPSSVTALLGSAPKIAAVALLLRVMIGPFGHLLPQWQLLVEIISIASMVLGSLAPILQTSIKRLMAYSSIGHIGYALMGLAAGTASGTSGTLIYLATYLFMTLGTFGVILAMRRQGRSVEKISDLAGLGRNDGALALAMTIFMLSMAGVPPLSGFFGKLYVFLAAIQSGLWTLAVIGVLTSIIGAYYYLRIIKIMYFDAPLSVFDRRSPSLSFVVAASGIVTLFFILVAGPITAAAQAAASALLG
jgi:NADH-quinone oxidoreductase subunit N